MDIGRDGPLLLAAQFNAKDSVQSIAKKCRISTGVANYRLAQFRANGVIRPELIFNPHTIGLQQFTFYASLIRAGKQHSALLEDARLGTHWLALVGGIDQVAGSLYAPNAAAAASQLEVLTQKLGGSFLRKSVSIAVSYAFFRKKYFSPQHRPSADDAVVIGREHGIETLDDVDRSIIHGLTQGLGTSEVALAKSSGIPRSSVNHRLKRLTERKIVLRQIYHIRSSDLGFTTYRVLVSMTSISKALTSKLFGFAALDPSTTAFHHTIGGWDYDFFVEVKRPGEISEFIDRLSAVSERSIVSMKILPVLKQTTGTNFLTNY